MLSYDWLVIGDRTILDRKMPQQTEGSVGLNLDSPNGNIISLTVDNLFKKGISTWYSRVCTKFQHYQQ